MKPSKLILCFILGAISFSVYSQVPVAEQDSIDGLVLDEIVVQGRTQRVVKHGVEYTPAKRIKRTSVDATNLLYQMQIPQLDIVPGSASIKTVTGKSVATFIDYRPVSEKDLQGLRPEDVLRVEVLNYPDDPRFQGAQYVVNFIMQHYEWGGYTKLTANDRTLADDNITGDLYSKFVFKKWTVDASVSIDYNKQSNSDCKNSQTFRDIIFAGEHYSEIIRNSRPTDYLKKTNSQWSSLRATYETDITLIEHSISLGRYYKPAARSEMQISLITSNDAPTIYEAYQYEIERSLYPTVSGYYRFRLPENNTLIASWDFSYTSSFRNSLYSIIDTAPIINDNTEKVYSPDLTLRYFKKFSHNNTLRSSVMSVNQIYNTRYSGSYDGVQKLLSSENMLFLDYSQNWDFGLSLFSRIGASYVLGRVNGETTLEQWNPRLGLQLDYKLNDKHSFNAEGWWANSHPQASTSNDALVQSNELLWFQGNPDLKNVLWSLATASYSFIPTNNISLSAILEYEGNRNKQAFEFYTKAGIDGLIRRTINSGNNHHYAACVSVNWRLLNNSLSFKANGYAYRYVFTGTNAQSLNTLFAGITAQYSANNLSASLFYNTPASHLLSDTYGSKIAMKSAYGISINYAIGNVKASLIFNNWFSRNGYATYDYSSPRYALSSDMWNLNLSRSLRIAITYILPYGKKVSAEDEIYKNVNVNSAILR